MEPADPTSVLGDFDSTRFVHGSVRSTFFRRGDAFFVRTDGPDGSTAEFPIEYTFGIRPLQQYLVSLPDGRRQALGIAWDSRRSETGGQGWFPLFPDVAGPGDPLHWTRPAQNWNHMCAECHSTDLRKNYAPSSDSFETTWAEIDVSCEACHGPGSRHVAWARDADRAKGDSLGHAAGLELSLRNPASVWRLPVGAPTARRSRPLSTFRAEIETCGRCHSRRGQIWDDYRFGRPLGDTHRVALLDEGLYYPDGQILDEVYEYGSFLQSRMYAAGVTCSDCHDPHSLRLRAEGNAVCATCHAPQSFDTPDHHRHPSGSIGASCVECHMPARSFMLIDSRRDHGIRIPRPDLTLTVGTPNACSGCHEDRSAEWVLAAFQRWFERGRPRPPHYAEALEAGRGGLPGAAARLLSVFHDATLPGIVRATALSLLPVPFSPTVLSAFERAAADPDLLVRRAAAERIESLPPRQGGRIATRLLADPVRAVRLEAVPGAVGLPRDSFPREGLDALDAAIAEYRRSQAVNADRADAHLNLGNLEASLGRPAEAEAEYRRALARDPAFVPATINLADLYRAMGRDPEAEGLLRGLLSRDPKSGEAHHVLGLLLVRAGRLPEALDHLGRAVDLQPEEPRFAYVHAVALHDTGHVEQALRVLEAAQARHPGDPDLLTALVAYAREIGRAEDAARWAAELEILTDLQGS